MAVHAAEGPPVNDAAQWLADAVGFEHGEGVARDELHAASLYCSAAKAGSAEGYYRLGWMYANGRGMPVNERYAARLFKVAQGMGHEHAAVMTGLLGEHPDDALPPCLAPEPTLAEESAAQSSTASATNGHDAAVRRDLRVLSGARIHGLVQRLAPRYKVDPDLAMAIIYVESGFNTRATSVRNAQGLMQLIPETAARFQVRNTYDAEENIRGGLAYLRWLMLRFKGNVEHVEAAYNAGEGAVDRFNGVPPYPETRAYVARLAGLYRPPSDLTKANGSANARSTSVKNFSFAGTRTSASPTSLNFTR